MQNIFVRILVAVFGVLLALAIFPPFMRVIGFPVTPDLDLIFRICVAAIAVLFIWRGHVWLKTQ